MELQTLVRCLWLSGVHDQLNPPNLCCLEEITQRVCQLVEAYEPNWTSVKWLVNQRALQLQRSACIHEEFCPQEGKGGR